MINKIKDFFYKNEWALILIIVVIFISIRLPGTSLPLHQDEYKWPMIVNPAIVSDTEIPHPPLSQFIYRTAGAIVGYNVNFRFVPLFFGVLNLLLLYYFLRMRFGRNVANIGVLIFTLSYFSVLASLMVDTDGQIMPFFFLISLIGYYKAKKSSGNKRYLYLGIMVLAMVLGFFIKVSFILSIGAIVADFLWEKKSRITKTELLKYIGYIFGGVVILVLLLVVSQFVFSFFDLSKAVVYWEHFVKTDRNWLQTFIQVIKAILYLSPFMILVPFLLDKDEIKKVRTFLFFILFGLVFYIIIFDFSIGALDRYMQFLIVPLTVISSVVISDVFHKRDRRDKEYLFLGIIISLILLFLLFVPHFVPSLHPKSAWISRVLSLKWNFLYPFSGGSGPLGFYVSFLFMVIAWLVSIVLVVFGLVKTNLKKTILLILIPIGLVYNLVFTEEYLFGKIYGSAPKLLANAVLYIKNNQNIKQVIVYNDNGGDEIRQTGKYFRRMYAVPEFEDEYRQVLANFEGYVLMIDIPRIEAKSFYSAYLDNCGILYSSEDKDISAKVYYCKK